MGVVKVKVMGHNSDVMWPSDVNVGLVSPPLVTVVMLVSYTIVKLELWSQT